MVYTPAMSSSTSAPLRLVGALGSPYSVKLRALIRYRRIPFRWVPKGSPAEVNVPPVKVPVIPVLVFPGENGAPDTAEVDSTPLIARLERDFEGRSVYPDDEALGFLNALLEDYADEWATKCMFHYRWAFEADAENASRVLPLHANPSLPEAALTQVSSMFGSRQVGRLGVVGSSPETAPLIEASYENLLARLDELISSSSFLFGERPSSADFALFGQLSQLVKIDPTSAAVARNRPRVVAWVDTIDDLSWLEPASWGDFDAVRGRLEPLLEEVGATYAPFLLANAAALESGSARVRVELRGRRYEQDPFKYQLKCLRSLRQAHQSLTDDGRKRVDEALAGTGCDVLFRG